MSALCELILYACPLGELASALSVYFERSSTEVGRNLAHDFMPHISLTGFFHDRETSIPTYISDLDQICKTAPLAKPNDILIQELIFRTDFHGLQISSPFLQLIARRLQVASSSTSRRDAIRLKGWLHLSLAYGFPPDQHERLEELARLCIDVSMKAHWALRLYERQATCKWQMHGNWVLPTTDY